MLYFYKIVSFLKLSIKPDLEAFKIENMLNDSLVFHLKIKNNLKTTG